MNLLKRLEITNFQSHEYTDLYFDDGVNIILGPSDSGKTAVIRAIKWVLFNEPSGSDFIRKDSKEAIVSLYFNNDLIVTRGRSKSKNYYEITFPSGESERYEGFGTKVPEEITELTKIHKVNLDGSNLISLSISDQLESPFLITESPSIKALAIGKIAGVEKIDSALNKLSKDINEINSERKSLEKEKSIQEDLIKRFDYLEEDEKSLNYIKTLLNKIDFKKKSLSSYRECLNRYSKLLLYISSTETVLEKLKNIDTLESRVNSLVLLQNKYNTLNLISRRYTSINDSMSYQNKILKSTDNLQSITEILNRSMELFDKYNKLFLLKSKITPILRELSSTKKNLQLDNSNRLTEIFNNVTKIQEKYADLFTIKNKLKEINIRINNGHNYMNNFKNIDTLIRIQSKTDSKYNLYFKLNENHNILKKNGENIYKTELFIKNNIEDTRVYLEKYVNILKESGKCPYCFNELDEKHLNEIISEYEVKNGL